MEGETGDQEVVAALVIAAGAVAEAQAIPRIRIHPLDEIGTERENQAPAA